MEKQEKKNLDPRQLEPPDQPWALGFHVRKKYLFCLIHFYYVSPHLSLINEPNLSLTGAAVIWVRPLQGRASVLIGAWKV